MQQGNIKLASMFSGIFLRVVSPSVPSRRLEAVWVRQILTAFLVTGSARWQLRDVRHHGHLQLRAMRHETPQEVRGVRRTGHRRRPEMHPRRICLKHSPTNAAAHGAQSLGKISCSQAPISVTTRQRGTFPSSGVPTEGMAVSILCCASSEAQLCALLYLLQLGFQTGWVAVNGSVQQTSRETGFACCCLK